MVHFILVPNGNYAAYIKSLDRVHMPKTIEHLEEIERIEDDDAHHDFGGGHGNKGHDFAHFWLIVRVLEVELAQAADYMFICEYVQDVAEFDSSSSPAKVTLYQLKKKEDGYWTTSDLTGQTEKSKAPKATKPIAKLNRSIHAFKQTNARGVFISNAKFDVDLSSKDKSTNLENIRLSQLSKQHCDALRQGLSKFEGVDPFTIDLDRIELQSVALEVNDLQRHTTGRMFDFLSQKSPEHAGQAGSLVDAIYVQIRARSRQTNKCQTWAELVQRRGFGKLAFKKAVENLQSIPDKNKETERLLNKLSQEWLTPHRIRVSIALSNCLRDKVLVGKGNRWDVDVTPIRALCAQVVAGDITDEECFLAVSNELKLQLSAVASDAEISALAIFEMIESWT